MDSQTFASQNSRNQLLTLSTYGLLLLLCILSSLIFNSIGWVGEVSIGGHAKNIPQVIQSTDPLVWSQEDIGLIRASSSRPMLRIQIGDDWLPLAINTYTGGIADWPARILTTIGLKAEQTRWLYPLWSALICMIAFRTLKGHLGYWLALWVAVSIAMSWDLILYRTALAGTEQLLYSAWTAALLLIFSESKMRQWLIVTACGIHAKLTFGLSILPLLVFTDGPKKTQRFVWIIIGAFVAFIPMLVAIPYATIPSHDTLLLQLERVWQAIQGHNTAPRETWSNMMSWLINPSSFWENLYDLPPSKEYGIRGLCLLIFIIIGALAWKHQSPFTKKFRQLSSIIFLQSILLTWIAKDIHHFGVLSISLSFWVGLLSAHLFKTKLKPHKIILKGALLLWIISQIHSISITPQQWKDLRHHGLSKSTQNQICQDLIKQEVKHVVTLDYDIYGILETACPQVKATHGWGLLAQHRGDALKDLIILANGSHMVVFPDSQPWIYNLRPSLEQIQAAAPSAKVQEFSTKHFKLYAIDIDTQEGLKD